MKAILTKNFDSSESAEFLSVFVDFYIGEIERIFTEQDFLDPTEFDVRVMISQVEILSAVVGSIRASRLDGAEIFPSELPDASSVKGWRNRIVFDAETHFEDSPRSAELVLEIARPFERLLELCIGQEVAIDEFHKKARKNA